MAVSAIRPGFACANPTSPQPDSNRDGVRPMPIVPAVSLRAITHFCRLHGMKPTTFGRRAANDPRLIGDMRNGRILRPATVARVLAFMANAGGC